MALKPLSALSQARQIVADVTQIGTEHSVNQDAAWTMVESAEGRLVACAAVFDGHGIMGEVASAEAAADLSNKIRGAASRSEWFDDPEAELVRLMKSLHDAVLQAHAPERLNVPYVHEHGRYELRYELSDDRNSFVVRGGGGGEFCEPIDFGCTATVGILVHDGQKQRVVCGNLGDSPAVLYGKTADGDRFSTELSELHAASEKAEQQRVLEVLGDSDTLSVNFDRKYLNCVAGPLQGHSIEPTRGLGHPVWGELGFSHEPHIRLLDVAQEGLAVLVVMSDGISDVLNNHEIEHAVLEVVQADEGSSDSDPASRVASRLVEQAVAAVDGGCHDDATAAVILLHVASSALRSVAQPAAAHSERLSGESQREPASGVPSSTAPAPAAAVSEDVPASQTSKPASPASQRPSRSQGPQARSSSSRLQKAPAAQSRANKPRGSSPQPQKAQPQRPRSRARAPSPLAGVK